MKIHKKEINKGNLSLDTFSSAEQYIACHLYIPKAFRSKVRVDKSTSDEIMN